MITVVVYKEVGGAIVAEPLPAQKMMTLPQGQTLLYILQGKDWDDVMTQHHKKQGWEPYKPMKE